MTSQLQGKLACESQPQGKHDHIDQLSAKEDCEANCNERLQSQLQRKNAKPTTKKTRANGIVEPTATEEQSQLQKKSRANCNIRAEPTAKEEQSQLQRKSRASCTIRAELHRKKGSWVSRVQPGCH
jgi:hypothetical protein